MLAWAGPVRVTLGGHQGPIEDLPGRVAAIRGLHAARLARVLGLLQGPHTIADVAHDLFPNVHGYNVLAGAGGGRRARRVPGAARLSGDREPG